MDCQSLPCTSHALGMCVRGLLVGNDRVYIHVHVYIIYGLAK